VKKILILSLVIFQLQLLAFENQYLSCTLVKEKKHNNTIKYISVRQAKSLKLYMVSVKVTEEELTAFIGNMVLIDIYGDPTIYRYKETIKGKDLYTDFDDMIFVSNNFIDLAYYNKRKKIAWYFECSKREKTFKEKFIEQRTKAESWFN